MQLLERLSSYQWFKITSRSIWTLPLPCMALFSLPLTCCISFLYLLGSLVNLKFWYHQSNSVIIYFTHWNYCMAFFPQRSTHQLPSAALPPLILPISIPLCEAIAKMEDPGCGETSLWTNFDWQRLSSRPVMSPHFRKQSESNVCSADNVSNQNAKPAWQLWEKIGRR